MRAGSWSCLSFPLLRGMAELQLGGGEHLSTVDRSGFHPPPQMEKKEKAKKGETLTTPCQVTWATVSPPVKGTHPSARTSSGIFFMQLTTVKAEIHNCLKCTGQVWCSRPQVDVYITPPSWKMRQKDFKSQRSESLTFRVLA